MVCLVLSGVAAVTGVEGGERRWWMIRGVFCGVDYFCSVICSG